ncbi:674_t:CDS:2, partial [Acaulospora colombiana]
LHDELLELSNLRSCFMHMDDMFYVSMKGDDHAIRYAIVYYDEPYMGPKEETPIKEIREQQSVQIPFDAIFEKMSVTCGQLTIAALDEAIPALKDHTLTLLPEVQRELVEYVDGYEARYYTTQRRYQSWVPLSIQDFIWGSVEPAPEDISCMKSLLEEFDGSIQYLQRLPIILEELRDHFKSLL